MNEIINYELNSCIEGTKRQNHISGRKVGSRTAIYSSFHVHAASRKTPSEDWIRKGNHEGILVGYHLAR